MPTIPANLSPTQKEFVKLFRSLCYSRSAWTVWQNYIELTAITIANNAGGGLSFSQDREDTYLKTISGYTPEEQTTIAEMTATLIQSLDRSPQQDFLGSMFMALELGSNWHGQFFTPYNLCQAMADMVYHNTDHWQKFGDPTCGAGALLIALRNKAAHDGKGYRDTFFIGQDISPIAGMMCYIQLSLLGCAGYVCVADTLVNPCSNTLWPHRREGQDIWLMPMWFDDVWQARMMREYKLK